MLILRTGPDNQDAFCAKMNGRGNRRQVAHRSVAKVFAMNADGRKNEGDCAGGQQVIDGQRRANPQALDALPGMSRRVRLKKTDAFAGFVSGGGDADRMQSAVGDGAFDAAEIEIARQQFAQGRVVEQRSGRVMDQPSRHQHRQPTRPGRADSHGIRPVDVAGSHVAPDVGQSRDGFAEIVGQAGNGGGIDGAGRSPAKDGEGVVARVAGEFCHSEQNTNLIGGAGATAAQDQRGAG